jgi:AmmeMemoRadiSam system protein A
MKTGTLSLQDRSSLLQLARNEITNAVEKKPLSRITVSDYSPILQAIGASFVTLTLNGNLRGCIGTLHAHQPLVLDVVEHAVAAALEDYRFEPVKPRELANLTIEISVLSNPIMLKFFSPEELLEQLVPGEDGVILKSRWNQATYLPQVWKQLPDKRAFLSHLCEKMGAPGECWKDASIQVYTYQVEEFMEKL